MQWAAKERGSARYNRRPEGFGIVDAGSTKRDLWLEEVQVNSIYENNT